MTRRALDLLGAGKADAYDAALTALREDTAIGGRRCSPATPMSWRRTRSPTRPMRLALIRASSARTPSASASSGHDGPVEPALEEVPGEHRPDGARSLACADECHGPRLEGEFQVANAHLEPTLANRLPPH